MMHVCVYVITLSTVYLHYQDCYFYLHLQHFLPALPRLLLLFVSIALVCSSELISVASLLELSFASYLLMNVKDIRQNVDDLLYLATSPEILTKTFLPHSNYYVPQSVF